jgi:hypothetical protein
MTNMAAHLVGEGALSVMKGHEEEINANPSNQSVVNDLEDRIQNHVIAPLSED